MVKSLQLMDQSGWKRWGEMRHLAQSHVDMLVDGDLDTRFPTKSLVAVGLVGNGMRAPSITFTIVIGRSHFVATFDTRPPFFFITAEGEGLGLGTAGIDGNDWAGACSRVDSHTCSGRKTAGVRSRVRA